MIPPEKIILYRKVRALAERGVPGERDNARGVLASLEARYPGIREAAAASPSPPPAPDFPWGDFMESMFGRRQAQPPRPPTGGGGFTGSPPPPGPSAAPASGPGVREAFEWTRDFLRGVAEDERRESVRATLVEEHATVTSRFTDDGDLVVRLRVTEAGRRALRRGAGTADLWAIAQQVGKDVADEFVGAMEEEAEAEREPKRRARR